MLAAGNRHTVLLKSDGTAVGCGYDFGAWNFPHLEGGLTYAQVSAGVNHTVLLRSNGTAVVWGDRRLTPYGIPALDSGPIYTQVAAGGWESVLLRSDGTAVTFCHDTGEQSTLRTLAEGVNYTYVAAGWKHTVLLTSDGSALVHDRTAGRRRRCVRLIADCQGLPWTQAAAGDEHVVLLRKDGIAVVVDFTGLPHDCNYQNCHAPDAVPVLEGGLKYTHVAAGDQHTVLLRSNGTAVATGANGCGQCNIPTLEPGLSYTDVSAGGKHTVLLRSDGTAVACGDNSSLQCNLPTLETGRTFGLPTLVLQASFDGSDVVFKSCDDRELFRVRAKVTDCLADIRTRLAIQLCRVCTRVDAIFPIGKTLSELLRADPLAVLGLLHPSDAKPARKRAKYLRNTSV